MTLKRLCICKPLKTYQLRKHTPSKSKNRCIIKTKSLEKVLRKCRSPNQHSISKKRNLKANKIVLGQILIVDESATAKPFYKLNGVETQMPQQTSTPKLATADLIQQTGIAFVDESMQVLHADAPIGTIIKVTNLDNGKQCLVRVTGQLDTNRFKSFIISIGNEAQEKLGSTSATIRIKLEYAIKP